MRNIINRSTNNVIVDRQDRVVVAGIEALRTGLSLYPSAFFARATAAHATAPGSKSPGLKCE
ncbi:MAG TPA: hypothetical protein VL096_19460, partial [Pirellulaceae bacterium]|nr:hypothetical protein [Pirellulaceae bacterium]